MNKRDRIQLEDLAVASALHSYQLHPALPLARHVRVALRTYQAGYEPAGASAWDAPEPDPAVTERIPEWWYWVGLAIAGLCAALGYLVSHAS